MIRKCFVMKAFSGLHDEYKKRHSEIWPEVVKMLHEYGAKNYSIFLDPKTNELFAYLEIEDEDLWSKSSETEICQRWWKYMRDVMETNEDNSPVSIELKEMFHLE